MNTNIVYRGVCILVCGFFVQPLWAGAADREATPANDWERLIRIQRASERLNYSGVFIYQMDGMSKSSRITHLVDGAGTHEKLEMLDGKQREYIRHNEEVHSYRPDSQTIIVEKRHAKNHFPGLSAALTPEIAFYYEIRRLPPERVAGIECQGLALVAKDNLRYSYRLWADRQSGLLLKTEMLDEQNLPVEQIVFTEVRIGGYIERQQIKPGFTGIETWRVVQHAVNEANLTADGWQIRANLPGFRRVRELRRSMPGQPEAGQIVLSDGMSAISVFVQSYQEGQSGGTSVTHQGAINIFARRVGDYWVTVVGEVPARTIKLVAESIEYKPVK
jgi:sigma-E factor negative regulatory protein RseB